MITDAHFLMLMIRGTKFLPKRIFLKKVKENIPLHCFFFFCDRLVLTIVLNLKNASLKGRIIHEQLDYTPLLLVMLICKYDDRYHEPKSSTCFAGPSFKRLNSNNFSLRIINSSYGWDLVLWRERRVSRNFKELARCGVGMGIDKDMWAWC